jgi:hypothetical protein
MGMVGDAGLHFWVVRGVARRMGVNVNEAMYEGRLSRVQFDAMVARCRACPRAGDCLSCLAADADLPAQVPGCVTVRDLAGLRA